MVAWSLSFCRSVYKRAVLSLLPSPLPPAPPRVCARRWARAGERAGAAQDQILKPHVLVSVTELVVNPHKFPRRPRARRRRCGSVTSHHGTAGSGRRRHGCSGRCAAV